MLVGGVFCTRLESVAKGRFFLPTFHVFNTDYNCVVTLLVCFIISITYLSYVSKQTVSGAHMIRGKLSPLSHKCPIHNTCLDATRPSRRVASDGVNCICADSRLPLTESLKSEQ